MRKQRNKLAETDESSLKDQKYDNMLLITFGNSSKLKNGDSKIGLIILVKDH